MGRDRTLTFDDDLAGIFMANVDTSVAKVVAAITTDLLKTVKEMTPKKTGCARASWVVGLGAADTRSAPLKTEETPVNNEAEIAAITGHEKVYVSNSLPYIMLLEFGGVVRTQTKTIPREGAHMLTMASLYTSSRLEQIVASTL